MLTTPFGNVVIICDGKEVSYNTVKHEYCNRSYATPIENCYRITDFNANESIVCIIEDLDSSISNTGGSGEKYLDSEFIKDYYILTIGVEDEHPAYNVERLSNGLKINIINSTHKISFGIA